MQTSKSSLSSSIKNGRFRLNLDKFLVFLGFLLFLGAVVQFVSTQCNATSKPAPQTPSAPEVEKFPLDTPLPGPAGPYSRWILHSLQKWPPASVHFLTGSVNPVEIQCLARPGEYNAIGAAQRMQIGAPIETVSAIVDGIDRYADLFPGYKQVRVESKDSNLWLTFWEQIIPIFFVPNLKYEMDYLVNQPTSTRKTYRYQLHKKGTLKYSDGAIVLESAHVGTTYTEFDFFDADWGIATSFGGDRIWNDSIEVLYLSDLAIKLKAENPSWTERKAADEAKTYLKRFKIRDMIKTKIPFPPEDSGK